MTTAVKSAARVTIPPGTPREECPRCGWSIFKVQIAGCSMPFDVRERGCFAPSSAKAAKPFSGEGICHLSRCPGRKD